MKCSNALTVIAIGISFACSAYGQTLEQSEKKYLDQLEQDKSEYNRNLITELGHFKKFDDLAMLTALLKVKERIVWLSERTAKPDSDYRLGYALAVYQSKIGDVLDAGMSLAKADLRSFVDSQRCEDKSSPQSRLSPWRKAAQPIYLSISALPQEQKAMIRETVEQVEPTLALRTASVWMCNGGVKQVIKLMQKYPEIGVLEAGKPVPQTILDKYPTVVSVKEGQMDLTDYSIQPDFMPEEAWKKELPTMILAFKKSYFATLGVN